LLMASVGSSRVNAVKYVYDELDKRMTAVTESGGTLMHAAVAGTLELATQAEICEVIRFLAEKGAKPDEKDGAGRTPLQTANRAAVPKDQVVQLLTELAAKSAARP